MIHRQSRVQRGMAMIVSLLALSLITACTSEQPKPLPQPTPDQVRGHADRTVDTLKQEEQERVARPPIPR